MLLLPQERFWMLFSSSWVLASNIARARTPPLPQKYSSRLIRVNSFRSLQPPKRKGWRRFWITFCQSFSMMEWTGIKPIPMAHKVFLITFSPTASLWIPTLESKVVKAYACLLCVEGRAWIERSRKNLTSLWMADRKEARAFSFKANSPLTC